MLGNCGNPGNHAKGARQTSDTESLMLVTLQTPVQQLTQRHGACSSTHGHAATALGAYLLGENTITWQPHSRCCTLIRALSGAWISYFYCHTDTCCFSATSVVPHWCTRGVAALPDRTNRCSACWRCERPITRPNMTQGITRPNMMPPAHRLCL